VAPAPVQGVSEVAASGRAVRINKVKPLKKQRDTKRDNKKESA
jgi:PiT family inorganic phosphate transporter